MSRRALLVAAAATLTTSTAAGQASPGASPPYPPYGYDPPPAAAPAAPGPAVPREYTMPYPVPPPPVPIELASTTPGAKVQLYLPSDRIGLDRPIASCDDGCSVTVPAGQYKVYITETDDTLGGSRIIELARPSRLVVDPDTREHRTVGLVLGITGPIAMVLGIAIIIGAAHDDVESRGRSRNDGALAVGALGFVGGAAATPIGWVMFGTSYKPEYELAPLRSRPRARAPSWSFGVVPVRHGLALGGGARF